MKRSAKPPRQCSKAFSGFTLISTSVVLVLVGLLLGGLLKGQELVQGARSKDLVRDLRAVPIYVASYQDRFHALPGDDKRADSNVGGQLASTPDGQTLRNNSRIEGEWNTLTPTDESFLFWEHLRRANLVSGATNLAPIDAFIPRNAEGGRIGVTSHLAGNWQGSYFVCTSRITGRFARQIDVHMDDGDTTTGAVRVYSNDDFSGTPTVPLPVNLSPINDAALYSVCVAY